MVLKWVSGVEKQWRVESGGRKVEVGTFLLFTILRVSSDIVLLRSSNGEK